jgi:hypothetical protein
MLLCYLVFEVIKKGLGYVFKLGKLSLGVVLVLSILYLLSRELL